MLPLHHRMTAAADFRRTIRRGHRVRTSTLVAHYWCCKSAAFSAKVGFAVGKPVGNAVVRHRVTRRLRHICSGYLPQLPNGSLLVVRALPAAAGADSGRLAADLGKALDSLARQG